VIESPSGRSPEKAPRWDLTGTEACGGGKVFWWTLLVLGEYFGIYGAKIRVEGLPRGPRARGRAPPRVRPVGLWAPRESSDPLPKSSGCLLVQEKSS
jgi:hypothetical protein